MSVIVHVGYPKTAGTWLQTRVFPAHPGLEYDHGTTYGREYD